MAESIVHVVIEVDLGAQPIEGSLRADDGIVRPFAGYMQLVTVLEAALSAAREAHPAAGPWLALGAGDA